MTQKTRIFATQNQKINKELLKKDDKSRHH